MFKVKNTREKGAVAEDVAARRLESLGRAIIERNYSCKPGEIDIICWDKGELVFVEVKSAAAESAFDPAYSVDTRKQTRIAKAAAVYIGANKLEGHPVRFDVALVRTGETNEVEILENAFSI